VNRLVKQFEQSRQMMKQMGGGKRPRLPQMPSLPGARSGR
jgi:signal recognition particle GTPase